MPRKLRVEYGGAIYHVMSRGDRREDIFRGDLDRHDFIKTLVEACQKSDWQIHGFCLLSNHYHLVLDTPNAKGDRTNLHKFMNNPLAKAAQVQLDIQ